MFNLKFSKPEHKLAKSDSCTIGQFLVGPKHHTTIQSDGRTRVNTCVDKPKTRKNFNRYLILLSDFFYLKNCKTVANSKTKPSF